MLGEELDTALLARVSGKSLDETLEALDGAAAARLLVPAAEGAGRVGFAHALVREALAQTLAPARRARLHAQAFVALLLRAEAGSEEALVAAVNHAISAVPLVEDERIAALVEQAAAAVSASYAAEDAARLLESAVQAVREPILLARLQCALGESLQRADRTRRHRRRSRRGERWAAPRRRVLFARAALGRPARR